MRLLLGLAAVALLSGCSSSSTTDAGDSEEPNKPDGKSVTEPAQSAKKDPGSCVHVTAAMAKAIGTGQEPGVGMKPGAIAAVKSPDFEKVYFIAMEFGASGVDDQIGVWASNSIKPGGGILMSVDGFAQQFTVWPDADSTDAAISKADPSVAAAKTCL